ncbi:Ankyrin-2 [Sparganum proliferum]
MNARALNGFTPLHIACKKQKVAIVELLLSYGAQIVCTTEAGLTPLHVAAFVGSADIVRMLLERGASVDQTTMRCETALHLAARNCQLNVAGALLSANATVDAKAKDDQTPLHLAVLTGILEMVTLLLSAGADPNLTTRDAYTALHIAAKEGRLDIVQALLEAGADPDARTRRGFSPLHLAAKRGRAAVARQLLQVKSDNVNAEGRNGLTPLHMAVHYNHVQLVELLLDHGADASCAAGNGYTALHIAAKKNHQDIASLLLADDHDNHRSTNAESRSGFTPLHLASQEGNVDMVGLLLLNGAEPNHQAKNGLTPLHLAAQEDRVNVAQQLVSSGADISAVSHAGYTPLHTACHFGRLNMVRYLLSLADRVDVNRTTKMGFTPLHLAAQQGHSQIACLLLEHGADANLLNEQGLTAAHIARRRHFPVLFDTLRTVTTVVTQWEDIEEVEEVILDSPEFMGEGAAVDSDDEGIRSPVPRRANGHAGPNDSYRTPELYAQQIPDQQASASVTDTVRVPVDNDQIWGEMEYLSQPLDEPINETIRREEQSGVSMTLTTDGALSETSKVLGGPGDHLDAEWEMETEVSHMLKKPRLGGFLVSFLVDARGGILDCKRYPGLRFIIPPNASVGPLRIICRFLRYPHSQLLPPLNDGEGLACRMMEMGPIGVRFNAPLLIEIPYCASLKSQQREIIVLRSDNGETWKEHPFDATDQAVQDSLGEYFNDAVPSTDLRERRVHRILTNTIPQYFALITRIRQDLILIGPEGSVLTSAVVPAVQVCFPPGALQKKIRVGLQVQDIPSALVTKCLGPRIAVSPIVSIEPRRRKFHRPITITIPLPGRSGAQQSEAGDNGQTNLSTIRLLCSITGGTSPAIWEDITGSSPFSMQQNCVSFTTTVSARLWLIDCPNLSEVTEMATTLYRESVSVPYFGQFLVYCRRHHPEEAQLRCVCLTDDTEQKTLECQEGFEILARGEPVEILHDHICWLESAGNLVPVAKSGEQLHFYLRAFEENRLNMLIRVKDAQLPHSGKLAFMPTQRTPGGTPVEPLTVLEVLLPRKLASTPRTGELERRAALEVSGYERSSDQIDGSLHPASSDEEIVESIARSDLDVKRIAQSLGPDWPALAGELGLSRADCDTIAEENSTDIKRAYACLLLWQERSNKDAATGTVLGRALRRIGRDDILKQCMKNIELVQDENELSVAVHNLQHEDSELEMHDDSAAASPDAAKQPRPRSVETNDPTDTSPTDVETLISPVASSHGDKPPNRVGHATEEERRAAVEQLVAELDDDIPTPPSLESGSETGVEEAELVPHVKGAEPQKVEASQVVTTESGVPLSMLQEDEANEPSEVAVRIPLEATGNNPPVISNDDSITTEKSEEPVTYAEPMVVSCKSAELSSLPSDAASPTSCTRHRSPANTQECHLSLTRPTGAFPYNQPIGMMELDDVFPPSSPIPGEFNVSCSTSATTTYRADLKTQQDQTVDSRAAQGASYISTASSGGPLISGEFVLVRQGFDDGPAPLVREKADFVVPIPLTRGAAAPSVGAPHPQQLVGPGTCKITAQLRKQALLDGHFRLCRSRSARGAGPRVRDAQDTEEDELPPEPPRRTTSLVAGRCSRDDMQVNYGGQNQPSGSPPLPFDAAPVTDLGVIPLWDGSHPREVDDLIKNLGWLATDRNIRE